MAEGEDKSQKTEEPTPKRLEDARKKGQVASSREVNTWFMILAGTIAVMVIPATLGDFSRSLSRFLSEPHDIIVNGDQLPALANETVTALVVQFGPLVVLMVAAAIASSWVQHGPIASVDKLVPKLENLSLLKGLGRLFSLRSIVEFAKGVLKMAIVGAVAFALVAPEIGQITASIELEPAALLHFIWIMALRLMGGVCAIITVIAGIDYLYQQYEFQKSMRMSKQEIKDEHKQTDGDPMVKGRLRQLRLERARKRMMAAVPEADVVITNPTHFAVALKYDTDTMDAPMLTAKGADNIAQRMREVAKEYDIPIIENPPLARALHAGVEVDQTIPETYYRAVAEVIGYVWRLKGKRSKQAKH
jgi:flagellar biosynthesis protein FlhB